MQGLVDSIFRTYPIPPLFLHEIKSKGLGGRESVRFEIVDGQQRIRALQEYFGGKFALLGATDKRLRLPNSLRSQPCGWGNQRFSELTPPLKKELKERPLDVFLIVEVSNDDEIRDLFIRLQSGTALSRQQIRDAWPGSIGPFIEEQAGKLDKEPAMGLFQIVDRRGSRPDDDRDQYGVDRQFCAQLLSLFLARESDPGAEQSIGASELDKLYHENTTFDVSGNSAARFKTILEHTAKVFERAGSGSASQNKKKFRKIGVICVFLLIQDLSRNPNLKLNAAFYSIIGKNLPEEAAGGRSTSGPRIAEFYNEWRGKLPAALGIRLDPKRAFDGVQQREIYKLAKGKCSLCGNSVEKGDGEYDHFPIPWRDGGKTEVTNGRLVHKECHPRGRPASQED